ncbi:hypothetical protein [Hymenobacter sp.]|uniref:hypothetical protein n=1 Tax=Hymenobacter sp. TaxID=1898978 RepID=UPI00286C3A7F|nr:hypothetical protein [Hymenobacter sp.]
MLLVLLSSCANSLVRWQRDFATGSKASIGSPAAAREAAIQYLIRKEGAAARYFLDSASVKPSGKVWLVTIPTRRGGEPGKVIMGLKSTNGRVGWIRLK